MGLDMYLMAERYVPGWEHQDNTQYRALLALTGAAEYATDESPWATLTINVGYWRKANAIHSWFVANVQNGVDECQKTDVSREQLAELKETCERVLARSHMVAGVVRNGKRLVDGEWEDILQDGHKLDDPAMAQEHLPTQSGFFFGSTDYDEGYFRDLEDTVKIIDRALQMPEGFVEGWSFSYRSSW